MLVHSSPKHFYLPPSRKWAGLHPARYQYWYRSPNVRLPLVKRQIAGIIDIDPSPIDDADGHVPHDLVEIIDCVRFQDPVPRRVLG